MLDKLLIIITTVLSIYSQTVIRLFMIVTRVKQWHAPVGWFLYFILIPVRFQDSNLSWNTTDPDVTLCFEKTVLIWAPCLFLWLFSPLEVYYLVQSKYRDIPWNWLNLSKMVCCSIIFLLSKCNTV